MRVAVPGDGVAEEEPVESRVVGREKRLEIVDDLLDDGAEFERGEVAPAECKRAGFGLKLIQKLAYLLNPLIHVAQNSTPKLPAWTRICAVLAQHNGHGEAVEALDADGLQSDGAQARMRGHHLETAARAADVCRGAFGLNHRAVARHVIHHNHGSAPRKLERPL